MNKPSTIIHSLDAQYYTDPRVFEGERAGLLARTWQFGCHLSDLPEVGSFTSFEIAGESLFAIRGRDEQVRVFYNVCQHRAHQLVSGTGVTRVVVCPYHAWTYELTGQLRSGPNIKAVEGFDKSAICLTEVRSEAFLGFLFVSLDPDAALRAITLGPARVFDVAGHVGSVQRGRKADLLVLSGDPLSSSTRVLAAISGGEVVHTAGE